MGFRSRPVAVPVPRLDDGVVRLRPPAAEDAEAIYAGCQDPDVGRFTAVPVPYMFHHATDWIERAPRSWETASATPMVILDWKTGELLGGCGLLEMRPDRAEIGYWVKREARGRGVATRAVRLLTDWALAEPVLHLAVVELLADVRNVASHRVAEKAGYVCEGEVPPPTRCAGRAELMYRYVRYPPG